MRRLAALLLLLGCHRSQPLPEVSLRFLRDGQEVRALSLTQLAAKAPPRVIDSDDPYYGKRKRFRALNLADVLALGFDDPARTGHPLAEDGREFLLRASDGYTVPMSSEKLHESGAFLAFADEDVPGYEPIGPRKVNPFPLYMVWTGAAQNDLEHHPRPWQLESIEMVHFEVAYPHTRPKPDAPAAETRGYALFRAHCFKCHAINREGGRMGPDLNVPQNVFEYLPADYVRAYVKNPSKFRYGVMPAHESLREHELDDLLAYVRGMKDAKHDPGP